MLYRFDACEFHPAARRLLVGGVDHVIGGRAFDLLQALVENHDRVMGKDELYEKVWPGLAVEPNNLQVQVWALRKVLGRHAIATVARRGYRFMPEVVRVPAGPGHAAVAHRRQGGQAAARPHGDMAARLAQHLASHRLVTLACADAAAGVRTVQAAAQLVATDLAGSVWQTEADVLTGRQCGGHPGGTAGHETALRRATERLHALLLRIARRPAVLVVLNGHQAEGLRDTVQRLLAELPRLRLVVSSPQALGLPGETLQLCVGDTAPAQPLAEPGGAVPAPRPMRWRSRA